MKKSLIGFLVVVFLVATVGIAGAAGYWAYGTVYYEAGGPVPNPVITITCYWPDGSLARNPGTSDVSGNYSAGWTGGPSLIGNTIKIRASKFASTGSKSWTAASDVEYGKNVYISSPYQINPDLAFETEPMQFATPGLQTPNIAYAYVYQDGVPVEAISFYAELSFDPTKMQCLGLNPVSPFDIITHGIDNGAGTISVEATAPEYIPLGDEGNPTHLFELLWEVNAFEPPGDITCVTVDNCEFMTSLDPMNPVPHITCYLIGEGPGPDIPTLTEWGLIIFVVVLLGFITWVFLRRRKAVAVKA